MTPTQRSSRIPLYPFLIGLYPVLSLTAENIWEISPLDAVRPAVVFFLGSMILLGTFRLAFKDWQKASLAFSLFAFLFFCYGYQYDVLQGVQIVGISVGKHRLLLPIAGLLLGIGCWWIARKLAHPERLLPIFTIAALGLWILPAYKLADYTFSQLSTPPASSASLVQRPTLAPDVYYIILDGYARQDALKEKMDYDNSGFLKQLKDMGFYVAECSQSNYNLTVWSLGSTLHMNYLQNLPQNAPLHSLVRSGLVQKTFSQMGYKIVAFETGYNWSQLQDADVYLTPAQNFLWITPFEDVILRTTAARVLQESVNVLFSVRTNRIHIARQLYVLDELKRVPQMEGPKFVFAHILVPHPPFEFGAEGVLPQSLNVTYQNGIPLDYARYTHGYTGQIDFINRQIIPILQSIQQNSSTPPIIILQGDHGFMSGDGKIFSILNAYYFPDENDTSLYPQISPVNSFRLVFNQFFQGKFELLPDISLKDTTLPVWETSACDSQ